MMKFTLLALLTGACSVTASSHEIDSTPLAGTVSGQPWTFVAGNTDGYLSQNEDNFFAEFYPKAYTACGSQPSGPHLIVAIPKVAGDYDMNLSRNMTFTDNSDNKIATDGRIVVTEVTATHVSGGLVGTYDADNDVNGQFDLTVCASN